jgi:hypothetical protein
MKILIATTSTGDTENIAESLRYMEKHTVSVFHYDQKWTQEIAIQGRRDQRIAAASPPDLTNKNVGCDAEFISHTKQVSPDLIVYISAWGATFSPSREALAQIHDMAPMVHMIFDGADPPWWGPLAEMEAWGVFDLTVTIDGAHDWPGGRDWKDAATSLGNALSLLTPISPQYYPKQPLKFDERPFPIGFGGNVGSYVRKGVVERLQQENMPFILKMRDDASYQHYATYLSNCQIIVNVPFTGSGETKHIKGRVIETALAQACLLEWNNPLLREWFTERLEFEEYANAGDCVDMCRFLITKPKRCEEIAMALYERASKEHSPESFWGKVFDSIKWRNKIHVLHDDGCSTQSVRV